PLTERRQQALIVLACSNRDSYTARAAVVARPITHQNAAGSHLANKSLAMRAYVEQHEVRAAWPVMDAQLGQLGFQFSSASNRLGNVILDEVFVGQRRRQTCQRNRVQVVRGCCPSQNTHLICMPHQDANPESRQAVSFRESARNEYVRELAPLPDHGLATKFKISFIDQDRGLPG